MNYIKYTFLFIILFIFFIIINTNLSLKLDKSFLESIIFASITELLFIWSNLKFIFIIIANLMFSIMVVFFVFGFIETANIVGTLAFGILLITLIFYLPQLIKNGYIEDI